MLFFHNYLILINDSFVGSLILELFFQWSWILQNPRRTSIMFVPSVCIAVSWFPTSVSKSFASIKMTVSSSFHNSFCRAEQMELCLEFQLYNRVPWKISIPNEWINHFHGSSCYINFCKYVAHDQVEEMSKATHRKNVRVLLAVTRNSTLNIASIVTNNSNNLIFKKYWLW